jgi:D-alanyl-D-alanine carboxypeptidase/D-alanyl-D-alanine-endopeptidase (penicillin-binding protein 4)
MTSAARPKFFFVLVRGLLLLSGWGVALWVFFGIPREPLPGERLEEDSALEEVFGALAADPSLAGASVAFCVLDQDGKVVVASPLATTALPPASALKTLTTAAALEVLKPSFRFETLLIASAPVGSDGVLRGDLTLVGSGDPTLTAEDIKALVVAASSAGLKRIEGSVSMDASVFPANPVSDHWNWGDIGNAYGAGAYGLNVDHNRLAAKFAPAAQVGAPAALDPGTHAPGTFSWINEVTTGSPGSGDQVVAYSVPYGKSVTLRGTVPSGMPGFEVSVANPDPPSTALELLWAALKHHDIRVTPSASGPSVSSSDVVLARHLSPPLSEIIPHLHRVSDNLEAQCLFLLLGKKAGAAPVDALREFWQRSGVEFAGLRLLDGSGLARANMIRPLDLARANHRAATGPHGQIFLESLSRYDGGKVRSKRGAMSGVRTEVGFVSLPDGTTRTFALMANGLPPGASLARHRAALLALAGHHAPPSSGSNDVSPPQRGIRR